MRRVWEFGDDAVEALTAAKEENDPEIRYRATLLLREPCTNLTFCVGR